MTADRQTATSRQQGRGGSCAESIPLGDRFQTSESVTKSFSDEAEEAEFEITTRHAQPFDTAAWHHRLQSPCLYRADRDARSVSGFKFAVLCWVVFETCWRTSNFTSVPYSAWTPSVFSSIGLPISGANQLSFPESAGSLWQIYSHIND